MNTLKDLEIPDTIDTLTSSLERQNYFASQGLATALFLALKLERPLLLEGIAGCGKTEVARVLAPMLNTTLIRLQCYEGLDTHEALYDWNYSRQLLHLRAVQATAKEGAGQSEDIYTEEFLLERPLLSALKQDKRPVLLLDELDRADADFEAFLLEFLEEFQVSIPEIGSIKAKHKPIVIITSNRTRELHDALKRRCIYHWVDLPDQAMEERIIQARLPDAPDVLAKQVADAVARIRDLDLLKKPGTSEAVDWARAITILSAGKMPSAHDFQSTLSVVLKDHGDHKLVEENLKTVLALD